MVCSWFSSNTEESIVTNVVNATCTYIKVVCAAPDEIIEISQRLMALYPDCPGRGSEGQIPMMAPG